MKTIICFLTVFLGLSTLSYSQVLWDVDINELTPDKTWQKIENIYVNSNGVPGLFDEVILVPNLGYIFYSASPDTDTFAEVMNELEFKLGRSYFVKDYIASDVINSDPSSAEFLESVKERGTFLYREWRLPDHKIVLFWNSDRFVVECYIV